MSPIPNIPIPEEERPIVASLLKDMRAALSYLSFYSADSPFVTQAVSLFHAGLSRLLVERSPLVLTSGGGEVSVNGERWEDSEVIARAMWVHACPGFAISRGIPLSECRSFLKVLATTTPGRFSLHELVGEGVEFPHVAWGGNAQEAAPAESESAPAAFEPAPESVVVASSPYQDSPVLRASDLEAAPDTLSIPDLKAMLVLVAEAWQLSRQVESHLVDTPQARVFMTLFKRFFTHFLERLGTVSCELESIQGWFDCPEGEKVESHMEDAMRDLLSVAVDKGFTDVLYDPAATGLVSECLAHWGSTGQHELLEKTVEVLAKGLQGDPQVREQALTHLMDSRPWVSNTRLVGDILDRLTSQLSEEDVPGSYQKGLLIAWDLLEPALEANLDDQVLGLLSTLHLHVDDEAPLFAERPALVRQWILGKSTPELVRRLVKLAHRHHRVAHFPLVATIAAPLLLADFYAAGPEEIPTFLRLFREMREQVRVSLMERLPVSAEEMEVRLLLLIVHTCGIDPALSLQISAWMAKGSRELKESILQTVEDLGDPAGGPALRLALLDDDEEIASEAARVLSAIGFKPAAPLMARVVKMRKEHGKPHEAYHAAVCRALGVFLLPETIPYLEDLVHKKGLFGSQAPSGIREAALRALACFPQPEAKDFLETVAREGDGLAKKVLEEVKEREAAEMKEEKPA